MAEYIERETAVAWFMPYAHAEESIDADVVISDIKGMKAADVAPVRHGRWVKEPLYISVGGEYKKALICSQCHSFFVSDGNTPWQMHNYCPSCGCRMDLEG